MLNDLINALTPVFIGFVVAVLAAVIKAVSTALIAYIEAKKEKVVNDIVKGKHEAQFKTAMEVWQIVDEHFRVSKAIGDTIQLKINMFNDLLLEKIPGLKQADIDYLRQTVAGEVNRYKAILETSNLKE